MAPTPRRTTRAPRARKPLASATPPRDPPTVATVRSVRAKMWREAGGNVDAAAKQARSEAANFGKGRGSSKGGRGDRSVNEAPTKVERVSLQNAASIAGLLLTTDAAIVEIKEKKKGGGGGGGHSHGGMDDMDY